MAPDDILSASQFASLQEVSKGIFRGPIPNADAVRLVELRLIYRLLGDFRLTTAGQNAITGKWAKFLRLAVWAPCDSSRGKASERTGPKRNQLPAS